MKKLIIYLFVFFCFTTIFAESIFSKESHPTDIRYQLFQTQNIWTFLKLDTLTGKIWQVQFSVEGDEYRFETVLSSTDITSMLKLEKKIGRYTLYPTQNTYNFILLDQIDGYTYQVQWSGDSKNRGILSIK